VGAAEDPVVFATTVAADWLGMPVSAPKALAVMAPVPVVPKLAPVPINMAADVFVLPVKALKAVEAVELAVTV
jgi:hypothetical protein